MECRLCRGIFFAISNAAMFCSGRCKTKDWRSRNKERVAGYRRAARSSRPKHQKKVCSVYFNECHICSKLWASSRSSMHCSVDCVMAAKRIEASQRDEKRHRMVARIVRCSQCDASYCPLYGCKPGRNAVCTACAPDKKRADKRKYGKNHTARARRYGVHYECFDITEVLARDGWICQICGIPTPQRLRGTCEPDAPELDHIVALAAGGAHTRDNTQCACRRCNGLKGDGRRGWHHRGPDFFSVSHRATPRILARAEKIVV